MLICVVIMLMKGGNMINICPVCGEPLTVTELHCDGCGTSLSGRFMPDRGCALSPEIMEFIKVFIYAEGNIKQVERLMNCSYPKVKNLLKKAKEELDVSSKNESMSSEQKNKILEQLNKGEITFDEAMERLQE
ncbi:MAG TPA: DUF2089 domain-containing protein [Firmicutes bacterium]|nr:DUF2089 domain-containing protein [Bacillota bacterium]